ncbi:RING-H2 finger protein ATL43-like [Gastrolobium bilobum]|uniref:RING-H2 finger protein ATL43-like n=1 Tax=Gastrolobium bilobum TaxID=150636 RepID=UPI002AB0BEA0|nr:RING-H2 finger protein ATL43-like [Gastrolobium bilobum]
MGGVVASFFKFKPFNFRFFFFFFLLILIVIYAEANDTRETPTPNPNPDGTEKTSSAFKPGMAVVVAVLTTMFSLTFLLLLYIKHCNGAGNIDTGGGGNITTSRAVPPLTGRKNSGIDRSIVESLPIFRFGALRGQKDGLDCAVCLTKFEAAEVLRLLPKCKHAFHVECVDTWLDAHSTCPLCRYRVDPEDILLVQDPANSKILRRNNQQQYLDIERGRNSNHEIVEYRRRHSSVGESESERQSKRTTSSSFRRSLDSATSTKKNESVGCFIRPRKDGMLLAQERDRTSVERRLEHRIIVSSTPHRNGGVHHHQRWSDVQASDLLYLTSEMMRWNTRGARRVVNNLDEDSWKGRGIINSRSVSEITGLSRFLSNNINNNHREWEQRQQQRHMEREEGLVSRWLTWISRSRSQPAVR